MPYRFRGPRSSIRAAYAPNSATMPAQPNDAPPSTFRRTLVRVIAMQLFALFLLALLQLRYN